MRPKSRGLLVGIGLLVVACGGGDPTIIALGDSVFATNSAQGKSIPDAIERELGTPVLNAAQGGAHFSTSDPGGPEPSDIRSQYQAGDWEWVVTMGGGNDYLDDCGCGDCAPYVDELISSDGLSGEIPDFVRVLLTGDTKVIFVGYYEVPSDAAFGFDRCGDEVVEHNARLALMAEAIDQVWFVSAGSVISAEDRTAYDEDRVHPSVLGARLVGEYIAETIRSIGDG